MGVNFIAAKKISRIGRMGNAAMKAKTPPRVPAPLPSCIRLTKSQRMASVAAKKSRLQIDPKTWAKTLPHRKNERITGQRETLCTAGVLGLRKTDGSILIGVSPFLRYATLG